MNFVEVPLFAPVLFSFHSSFFTSLAIRFFTLHSSLFTFPLFTFHFSLKNLVCRVSSGRLIRSMRMSSRLPLAMITVMPLC